MARTTANITAFLSISGVADTPAVQTIKKSASPNKCNPFY